MFKSILSILCFVGFLFSQIQYGGIPEFYENRTMEINFIQIDKSLEVDRNFAPMVFEFGNEYDVNIDFIENATIITDGNINTYFLGIESQDAYAIGINFDEFYLTPNSKLFFYDEEQTIYMGLFDSRNNKPNDVLTTSLIKSDRIIIELTIPIQELNDLNSQKLLN